MPDVTDRRDVDGADVTGGGGVLRADELKVLAVCAFLSGSMLMAPGERIAGAVAYGISVILFVGYRVRLRASARPPDQAPTG